MLHSLQSPLWMSIVNLSPDSFSDGGLFDTSEKIIQKSLECVEQGAHILDYGAVATNPNVKNHLLITPQEELSRLIGPLTELKKKLPKEILISVDTFSPFVAKHLAKKGLIDIINDIEAAQKIEVVDAQETTTAHVAAEFNLPIILMHKAKLSQEESCIEAILSFLSNRINICEQLGVRSIIIDPGIGYGIFGKNFAQVQEILKEESIQKLKSLRKPLLIGVSRKAFHLDLDPTLTTPISRDQLTKEIELRCIQHGANIIRTHNMIGSHR